MRLPRSIAGWTMAVFGILAIIMGATGLISPDSMLTSLGFEVVPDAERAAGDYTRTFIMASSMASFNMGIYYLVSVWTEWRSFYLFTAIFRVVTFTVFTLLVVTGEAPGRFFGVALWEGTGALATGIGLWLDQRHRVFSKP
ncbi:hypothetical protein [Catenuloplanes japonicus]|uniref:hypothetical protein n=1 Tax=Catenuloplanes japonicus TaxID=33876 RepID=UPI00068D004E|nr:hypothetical protein [Catenuloplanes japonicus]